MKIAVIIPKLANQGPVIVAKDILDNLQNLFELVDVYYFDEIEPEINLNYNLYKISLFEKIDFEKYDVVHSHMLRPDFYVWLHRKKRHSKILFVTTLHQNIYSHFKGYYNVLIAYVFEKLWLKFLTKQDAVITLTNEMNRFYSNKTKLNLKTIYNGRNLNAEIIPLPVEEDLKLINDLKLKYKIIGSHCLLSKRKGIHQTIESLVGLKDFAFVIVGDGHEMSNLKLLAKKLRVYDRCLFLGYKSDAISYLPFFDLYIMSSYSEGFPLGLLEAGLVKLPVVCSDIPIFRELFSENEVCFYELDNIKSLEESIKFCVKSKSEFSISLNKKIVEKYSINEMSKNYFQLYQQNL